MSSHLSASQLAAGCINERLNISGNNSVTMSVLQFCCYGEGGGGEPFLLLLDYAVLKRWWGDCFQIMFY